MPNIFTQIWQGLVTDWHDVETAIDNDYNAVIKAVPALKPVIDADVAVIKQGASDALGYVASVDASAVKGVAVAAEGAADAALIAATGGAALPLVPMVNSSIDQIASIGVAAFNAWALSAKAKLAGATPATMAPIPNPAPPSQPVGQLPQQTIPPRPGP